MHCRFMSVLVGVLVGCQPSVAVALMLSSHVRAGWVALVHPRRLCPRVEIWRIGFV